MRIRELFTGKDEVGGIAAYSSGTVKECTNKATVTATGGYAGGIVGYNYEGSILLTVVITAVK